MWYVDVNTTDPSKRFAKIVLLSFEDREIIESDKRINPEQHNKRLRLIYTGLKDKSRPVVWTLTHPDNDSKPVYLHNRSIILIHPNGELSCVANPLPIHDQEYKPITDLWMNKMTGAIAQVMDEHIRVYRKGGITESGVLYRFIGTEERIADSTFHDRYEPFSEFSEDELNTFVLSRHGVMT